MLLFQIHAATFAFLFARLVLSHNCLDGKIPMCADGTLPKCHDPFPNAGRPCPKACDPHNNRCDVGTAPTCIYPDPRVNGPRGACACRPGYKAAVHASSDIGKHWRLPILGHEHRVWVAEDVKCDTLCDVSTGVNSCLEVPLAGKECIGTGTNVSYPSVSAYDSGMGNYSRSLSTATTYTTSETSDKLNIPTDFIIDDLDDVYVDDSEPEAETEDGAGETDLEGASKIVSQEPTEVSSEGSDDTDDPSLGPASDLDDAGLDFEDAETPTNPDDALDDVDVTILDIDEESASTDDLPAEEDVMEAEESAEEDDIPPPGSSSKPNLEARQAQEPSEFINRWANYVLRKSRDLWGRISLQVKQNRLTAIPRIELSCDQISCPCIIRSVIDSCKRGVEIQKLDCKRIENGNVEQCKADVHAKIEECKKTEKIPILCERHRADIGACETKDRFKIPLCKFDKLSPSCCEALRDRAADTCSAGLFATAIQEHVQSAQDECSVSRRLAQVAMKAYLSGQALGYITQLESVEALGDEAPTIRKSKQWRARFEKWAAALQAAAEDNMSEAERLISPLAGQIEVEISNRGAWRKAAADVVERNVNKIFTKTHEAAVDLEAIKSAHESIKPLSTVPDDLKAIGVAARKCAHLPPKLKPEMASGWKHVTTNAQAKTALKKYRRKLDDAAKIAIECQAVDKRTQRISN